MFIYMVWTREIHILIQLLKKMCIYVKIMGYFLGLTREPNALQVDSSPGKCVEDEQHIHMQSLAVPACTGNS